MTDLRTGGCLCGAVRYTIAGPMGKVNYCHCSQCRRQSGHHNASANVADGDLEVEGARHLTWYSASPQARRGFCSICGSALFWKHDMQNETSVMAGSFDTPTGLESGVHIFVADKGDYYEIADSLPQYPGSSQ